MAKKLTIGVIITGLFALLMVWIKSKMESPVTGAMVEAGQEVVDAIPLDPAMKGVPRTTK